MSLTKFTNTEIITKYSVDAEKVIKKKRNYIKELVESEKYKEMSSIDKRGKFQSMVRRTWKEYNYNGMFIISMGIGKSKIIADAIRDYKIYSKEYETKPELEILILVNSSTLRDTGLPGELLKWSAPGAKSVKIECYQWLLHNKEVFTTDIGLLICDESDVSISPTFGKLVNKLKARSKLFLTGTLADTKRELLKEFKNFPPILYEYGLQEAQRDGLINKSKIFIHEVPLSMERNIEIKVNNEKYMRSENNNYIYTQDKIDTCKELEKVYRKQGTISEANKFAAKKKWWESNPKNKNNRVAQLTENQSLINYARKLRDILHLENEENKVVFFATRTDIIDKLTPNGYYGDVEDSIIKQFNTGEIREIGVCKKANRGVSFVGLNHCIAQSYNSSQTDQNQGVLGRMTRLPIEELAYIHILVSTYVNPANKEPTYCQNFEWVRNLVELNIDDVLLITDIKDTIKHINNESD
jgi:superfamily II DNA or RNA helicase